MVAMRRADSSPRRCNTSNCLRLLLEGAQEIYYTTIVNDPNPLVTHVVSDGGIQRSICAGHISMHIGF